MNLVVRQLISGSGSFPCNNHNRFCGEQISKTINNPPNRNLQDDGILSAFSQSSSQANKNTLENLGAIKIKTLLEFSLLYVWQISNSSFSQVTDNIIIYLGIVAYHPYKTVGCEKRLAQLIELWEELDIQTKSTIDIGSWEHFAKT